MELKLRKKIQKFGDIAQLSFDGESLGHTLVIIKVENKSDLGRILVATHTFDTFGKQINEYDYKKIRFVHILGGRKYQKNIYKLK